MPSLVFAKSSKKRRTVVGNGRGQCAATHPFLRLCAERRMFCRVVSTMSGWRVMSLWDRCRDGNTGPDWWGGQHQPGIGFPETQSQDFRVVNLSTWSEFASQQVVWKHVNSARLDTRVCNSRWTPCESCARWTWIPTRWGGTKPPTWASREAELRAEKEQVLSHSKMFSYQNRWLLSPKTDWHLLSFFFHESEACDMSWLFQGSSTRMWSTRSTNSQGCVGIFWVGRKLAETDLWSRTIRWPIKISTKIIIPGLQSGCRRVSIGQNLGCFSAPRHGFQTEIPRSVLVVYDSLQERRLEIDLCVFFRVNQAAIGKPSFKALQLTKEFMEMPQA